ncbi:multidrug MFS transporter [Leuconostoc gelidum subsp. gasicomitatum]|uniref:glycosyltransferase n=1 Tax=Leuconostoc gelidum group TaxID=3016637 RepID=UPI001CC36A68|nr:MULTISPECIES: glycosyltransferase [Leuconostoc gelidum group]MBZ5964366.1 multidrug MFS transporter [Leuconostoc gelidum subsp. gelidum]MBZ5996175.1 multidrug MFS transporter [Leuconostoc gasicomitatum]
MIFVTVGTHEQPFNRLIKKIDELVEEKIISEPVFMQIGFSDYIPKNVKYSRFLSYAQMQESINDARIIITHGGPASFISVLAKGKKPIVVPRLSEFHEHVNDHQLIFAKELIKKKYDIVIIEDIQEIGNEILRFTEVFSNFRSNNKNFMSQFLNIIDELV